MIQIERTANPYRPFRITIKEPGTHTRAQHFDCTSLHQVALAVCHYFPHGDALPAAHVQGIDPDCPLCK